MHRVILSSTPASRSASRRVLASSRLLSRNLFSSSTQNTAKARLPLHQQQLQLAKQQKNKSTLALPGQSSAAPQQLHHHELTREQMTSLFWSAAIPMVGFGFMDNFIMITAGSAIENSFGFLGLATMTAAAIGQVVSDVSGVVFGDTLSKVFNVTPARLTEAQQKLKIVGRIKLGGAVLGVIAGCTLGAAALLLIPDNDKEEALARTQSLASSEHHKQERITEQLQGLQKVMMDMMTSQDDPWHDKRASCTLYVNESMGDCIPASASSTKPSFFDFAKTEAPATIEALNTTDDKQVRHTLRERRVVVFANTIYVPMMAENNDILGIFKIKLDNGSFYNGSEIKDAKQVARNLGFFLNHMI